MKFEMGDKVRVKKDYIPYSFNYKGKIGKVISYLGNSIYLVKFDEKLPGTHRGSNKEDPSGMSRYINYNNLEHHDKEMKKIRDKKIKEIDPFGEEEWLNEKRILKYNQFINENSKDNSDIDPFNEENWNDSNFEIKKAAGKDGVYYFAIHNVISASYTFALGNMFNNNHSFSFVPAPPLIWSPLSDKEKDNIFNDILKIDVCEFSEFNGSPKVNIIKMTFTELCNTFEINKEDFSF